MLAGIYFIIGYTLLIYLVTIAALIALLHGIVLIKYKIFHGIKLVYKYAS